MGDTLSKAPKSRKTTPWIPCSKCDGAGMITKDRKFARLDTCSECKGTGRIKDINKVLEELSEQIALETTITSPLWLLLYIQQKTPKQTYFECRFNNSCYLDYMKSFKLLTTFFSPIAYPTYGTIEIPRLFCTYEMQQIANHLNVEEELIYTCMVKEVIPRLTGVLAYNE